MITIDVEMHTLRAQVASHRRVGVPEETIAGLPSGRRLAELEAFVAGESAQGIERSHRQELAHLEAVVALHRAAGIADSATPSGRRLACLRS